MAQDQESAISVHVRMINFVLALASLYILVSLVGLVFALWPPFPGWLAVWVIAGAFNGLWVLLMFEENLDPQSLSRWSIRSLLAVAVALLLPIRCLIAPDALLIWARHRVEPSSLRNEQSSRALS